MSVSVVYIFIVGVITCTIRPRFSLYNSRKGSQSQVLNICFLFLSSYMYVYYQSLFWLIPQVYFFSQEAKFCNIRN